MKILLTNDDGIFSDGLKCLYNQLKNIGKIYVIVPEIEKSATSHSINLFSPIRIKKIEINGISSFIVNGTPVDCVKIGIKKIIKEKIDMVVSGINPGPNLGMDILYSGTVSAASEGAILGIPSISVSIADYKNFKFDSASIITVKIIEKLKKVKFPKDTILNINIPNKNLEEIKGIKITFQSESRFSEEYEKRIDPRGNIYFWLKGTFKEKTKDKGSDVEAIKNGYVSITPIHLKLTDYSFFKKLKKIKFEKIEF
ncbi:MAG: 5'/3'-nucleotidase SurE [Candidatus Omnitrophica bacterium]|nr:5'/3'-nucleotidase SurE [Candidatus Omnitrophota bacterium]